MSEHGLRASFFIIWWLSDSGGGNGYCVKYIEKVAWVDIA